MKDLTRDIDFLCFYDQRSFIERVLGTEQYTCVYQISDDGRNNLCFYCGLIDRSKVKSALCASTWELTLGNGFPGCCRHGWGKEAKVTYDRFGHQEAEPFIFYREFTGFREEYPEISEEFRFFHNLYFNEKRNEFVKFDISGNEEVVIKYSRDNILIRTKEIREYLAVKNKYLAIFFDHQRYSFVHIENVPEQERKIISNSKSFCYDLRVCKNDFGMDKYLTFSHIMGKKLISPFPKGKINYWPFNEKRRKKYSKFIIGINKNGTNIKYTCNPDKLANYFGKNPDAPNYLTPVFFKREVLQKYYNKPEIFSVEDSYLRCAGMWGLRMDNHQSDVVIVYLGDLGRDLPEEESDYWLSFNIPPTGRISRVKFLRDFMAIPTDPEGADLRFKQLYKQLNTAWRKKYSWSLFRDLSSEDQHFLQNLRILLNNSQSELDFQVLSLSKVLIDSLNEAQLAKNIKDLPPNSKGITKLEYFLKAEGYHNVENSTGFLRNLQDIRSTGVAHLKGSKFKGLRSKLGIDQKELKEVFIDLLQSGIFLLQSLIEQVSITQQDAPADT